MSLKSLFLLLCCLVAVYSFNSQRSDNRKLWSGEGSSYPLTGYDASSRRSGEDSGNEQGQYGRSHGDNEGVISEGDEGSNQNRYGGRRPEGQGGQRGSRVRYASSSSSSSSEEHSSQSHELRKVEKQYHNTQGYGNGNNRWEPGQSQTRNYRTMNFEASDLHNAIDKDM